MDPYLYWKVVSYKAYDDDIRKRKGKNPTERRWNDIHERNDSNEEVGLMSGLGFIALVSR